MYRYDYDRKYAYPLTAEAARNRPPALTRTGNCKWIKKIRPIEQFGFIWHWVYVSPPERLPSVGPKIAVPIPPQAPVVTQPPNEPNVIEPAGDPDRIRIGLYDEPLQYYNIVTGEVRRGCRTVDALCPMMLGGKCVTTAYSLPPDRSGNWLVRAEAVRQGYISMTGQAGVQVNPRLPEAYGADVSVSVRAPEKTIFGMSPLMIGGLLLAAKLVFGSKR